MSPIVKAVRSNKKLMKKIEPIGLNVCFVELPLNRSELISEAEIITVRNDKRTADIAEYSNPNVPIKGRKLRTIETTITIAKEISTARENSILSNIMGSPMFYREKNIVLYRDRN